MQNDNNRQSPISEYLLKLQLIVSNTVFKNKTEANKYEGTYTRRGSVRCWCSLT